MLKQAEDVLQSYIARIFWRLGSGRMMGDGYGVRFDSLPIPPSNGITLEMASLDAFNLGKIPAYLRHLQQTGLLHLCSHPKLLRSHALLAFGVLIHLMKFKYRVRSDWRALTSPAKE